MTGQDSEANADHTASRDVDDIAAAVGGDVMASRRSPRDMPDGEGVTNRAAPGARVGLQSNGHVHGATVNMVVAGATGDVTHTQDTISARMRADAERIREQAHRHAADAYRRAEQHMQHTANHHAAGAVSGPHVYGVQAPVTFGTVVISDDGITVDGEQLT